MPLLSFTKVSVAFGLQPLLDAAGFQLDPGERACLIGRNGAGKSTLLKLAAGMARPDAGEIWRKPGLRAALLDQELPVDPGASVFETVAGGLAEVGRILSEYHEAAARLARESSAEQLSRVERLQHELEARDGWRFHQRIEAMISRLQLPADARLAELSGGWRRRVMLARALAGDPEALLLDEPTNHLDIETIEWLEAQLLEFRGGLLFVTHDRALLRRLATRILELDRGRLTSWPGDYDNYLEKKAAALEAETRQFEQFDKKLAQEEVWIRQGIKARRTRNEGRVRALEALREERRRRREQPGRAEFGLEQAADSGRIVIEAQNIGYAWRDAPLVKDFSIRILRGDRIGLIGPNGSGKTTLLQLLLGRLTPQSGLVKLGTRLEIAYFDQLREQIDPEKSVMDNVAEGRHSVTVDGKNRHVIGYLGDFLFSAERAHTPAKALSGGERNRLLLARLFCRPANLLVMDEPTNDLDLETLELLEERLIGFTGTLLLVSHDRAFLDNVVTSTLVFEGGGRVSEYVGGYTDWLRQRKPLEPAPKPAADKNAKRAEAKPRSSGKLSYKEQRELEQLPARIEALEAEHGDLCALSADPELYRRDAAQVAEVMQRLKAVEAALEAAYSRWDDLESIKEGRV